MDVVVPIAWVVDHHLNVHASLDGTSTNTLSLKKNINPFDAIALEEALCLKEKGHVGTITVLHIGTSTQGLLQGLAMGADQAILLETTKTHSPLGIAKILAKWLETNPHQLVLMGKQSTDDDQAQVGPMLAGLMGYAQGVFASKIVMEKDCVHITQEMDEGLVTMRCSLPSVITCDLRLNTPRYPSMMDIMQARKKTIEKVKWEESTTPLWQQVGVVDQSLKREGKTVDDIKAWVETLKEKGVV